MSFTDCFANASAIKQFLSPYVESKYFKVKILRAGTVNSQGIVPYYHFACEKGGLPRAKRRPSYITDCPCFFMFK